MLAAHFAARRAEMLRLIETLVAHESPSTDKAACDRAADHLAAALAPLGQVERLANPRGGDHLKLTVAAPGAPADAKPALVIAHYDTVWPLGTLARRPFRVEGEVAYGPGAYDMKASFALFRFAIGAIAELGLALPRPVVLMVNSDEEIGSPTSRALIEAEARAAAFALVLEPPVEPHGALKTARKGGGGFTIGVTGRSAHAGVEPEKGISAITEAAHQVLALNALADLAQGTTVNVGVLSAGTRPNVVPAEAHLEIDVRAWTQAEAERIERAIRALQPVTPGAQLRIQGGLGRPPMERGPATAALFAQAQAIGAGLGLALTEGSTGGGSDGNFTAAVGTPTLDGLGTPGQGAHAEHEQIQIPGLFERAALLTGLLTGL